MAPFSQRAQRPLRRPARQQPRGSKLWGGVTEAVMGWPPGVGTDGVGVSVRDAPFAGVGPVRDGGVPAGGPADGPADWAGGLGTVTTEPTSRTRVPAGACRSLYMTAAPDSDASSRSAAGRSPGR